LYRHVISFVHISFVILSVHVSVFNFKMDLCGLPSSPLRHGIGGFGWVLRLSLCSTLPQGEGRARQPKHRQAPRARLPTSSMDLLVPYCSCALAMRVWRLHLPVSRAHVRHERMLTHLSVSREGSGNARTGAHASAPCRDLRCCLEGRPILRRTPAEAQVQPLHPSPGTGP
jgi:hypothetical protein